MCWFYVKRKTLKQRIFSLEESNFSLREIIYKLKIKVDFLEKEIEDMALDFSKLESTVAKQPSVVESVKALVGHLIDEVTELKKEVADSTDMSQVQAKIDAFAKTLSDNNDALTKAVTDNSKDFSPSGN